MKSYSTVLSIVGESGFISLVVGSIAFEPLSTYWTSNIEPSALTKVTANCSIIVSATISKSDQASLKLRDCCSLITTTWASPVKTDTSV